MALFLVEKYTNIIKKSLLTSLNNEYYKILFLYSGKGRIFWGVSSNGIQKYRVCETEQDGNKTILMSAAENPALADKFKANGWVVKSVPGAGHKLMKVAIGTMTH